MPVVIANMPPIILARSVYLSDMLQDLRYLVVLTNPVNTRVISTSGETKTSMYRNVSGIHKYIEVSVSIIL